MKPDSLSSLLDGPVPQPNRPLARSQGRRLMATACVPLCCLLDSGAAMLAAFGAARLRLRQRQQAADGQWVDWSGAATAEPPPGMRLYVQQPSAPSPSSAEGHGDEASMRAGRRTEDDGRWVDVAYVDGSQAMTAGLVELMGGATEDAASSGAEAASAVTAVRQPLLAGASAVCIVCPGYRSVLAVKLFAGRGPTETMAEAGRETTETMAEAGRETTEIMAEAGRETTDDVGQDMAEIMAESRNPAAWHAAMAAQLAMSPEGSCYVRNDVGMMSNQLITLDYLRGTVVGEASS